MDNSQILPLCLDHNFWTWSAQAKVNPIPVKTAKGVYFWDYEGKRYLDFNSMTMCVNVGHGDERIIQAMTDQIRELTFAAPGMATLPRAELGQLLNEVTPDGLTKFLFTLGGSDANENAVKLARGHTGKFKVLARYRSYHGATYGALALSGDPRRTAWEPLTMPGVVHFLDPYSYRSVFHQNGDYSEAQVCRDYLAHLEEIIHYENPETIATIIMESITGTNGILVPPEGYMQGVRALCDKYNIMMIADEVMSGFGRTGKWFAVDHWNVRPDLMTMAKGLTSAYAPLGAVAMTSEIAASFNDRVYEGGLTFNGHPVSLAAAIANIKVMQEDGLVERSESMGRYLTEKLQQLQDHHPSIGTHRSIGLFGILELVKDANSREPLSPWNTTNSTMKKVRQFCLDHGLFLYLHWHTILIMPPLIITKEQIDEGFAILDEALYLADDSL